MMNVNDYQIEIPAGDMLQIIFDHQRDLMDKYHLIEQGIVGHSIPSSPSERGEYSGSLNVQDRASQLRMKDFAWRITEELTEATLALGEEDPTHYLEEIIDALHFSVELLILCGVIPLTAERITEAGTASGDSFERAFALSPATTIDQLEIWNLRVIAYSVIEHLGEAMNRLKLKPWKVTAMLTDEKLFHQSLTKFFAALIDLLKASGFTAKTATRMYLNKNAVNQFRIRSKY
jgi:dUTPase